MTIPVYLESGAKRVFAGAVDWQGWCRSGRDEHAALQALLASAPRYARALAQVGVPFTPPGDLTDLQVVERLAGNATTDFGAPNVPLAADRLPLDDAGLEQLSAILRAAWTAFEQAVTQAEGRALRMGPRGGGRDVTRLVEHVLGGAQSDLVSIGAKRTEIGEGASIEQIRAARQASLAALAASARGAFAPVGPRGGVRWPPRTYVRRTAWHVLDHAWELEDRILGEENPSAAS